MSTRSIRWTSRALRRLDEIGSYIAQDNAEAASRVISRIVVAIDALSSQPALGRIGRIHTTRELVLADIPYIIAYRVMPTTVDILTIMHSSQQWPDRM